MQDAIKTKIMAMTASLILITSVPGYAGDREWATAGKILTGVVAANVIGDLFCSSRSVTVERHVYRTYPKVTTIHHRRPMVKSYTYYESRNCPPKPEISYRTIEYKTQPVCSELVIVNIEDGRRIIQPRIHGATAYLQVYSKVSCDWVTIEEYPSIW